MDVKVVEARYRDRPKSDPDKRIFRISDHIIADAEKLRSGRMYVGDDYRAVVITLAPGQAQYIHKHPSTDHAWFIVQGKGEVTMEDEKIEIVEPGLFAVHPRNTVHGVKNIGEDNFVYIAVSIGD